MKDDNIDIIHIIQPSVVLFNTDEPKNPVMNGREGMEKEVMIHSQSLFVILFFFKSDSAPLIAAV